MSIKQTEVVDEKLVKLTKTNRDYKNALNKEDVKKDAFKIIGELEKMFAGKNFGVNPSIAEYMQGFTGSSSPKDLATALEVLHGYFVAIMLVC